MRLSYLALALAAAALPACTLHWGGDDDIICPAREGEPFVPDPGLVNPSTLACESFGGGGCGCGPCTGAEADALALPSWGSCGSSCIGLGEAQCAATTACRTTYDHGCLFTDGPCPALTPFLGCYPVDETGPIQGACAGLDAWDCSRHDDCLASYSPGPGCRDGVDSDGDGVVDDSDECTLEFQQCAPELAFECDPGTDCG